MKEFNGEERAEIAARLKDRFGEVIIENSTQLYVEEPDAIGIALLYLNCDCVVLRGFGEDGDTVGKAKILRSRTRCGIDHLESLDDLAAASVHRNILWKDDQKDFDRKYGNEKRIALATKLFPPVSGE